MGPQGPLPKSCGSRWFLPDMNCVGQKNAIFMYHRSVLSACAEQHILHSFMVSNCFILVKVAVG